MGLLLTGVERSFDSKKWRPATGLPSSLSSSGRAYREGAVEREEGSGGAIWLPPSLSFAARQCLESAVERDQDTGDFKNDRSMRARKHED